MRKACTASTPPLAQLLADPLVPGDTVVLRGRANRGTQLWIRYGTGKRLRSARFRKLGLARAGRASIRIERRGSALRPVLIGTAGTRTAPVETRRIR